MDIKEKIKLQFDDDFFKEEIRCGYIITEKTKKIWAIEIDLLNELITVCKKHNIKMCVSCGALLGAVRHKGMIPWDDDIDVSLTRSEYEKLCVVAPNEFKHPYFFQNYKTDPQYLFGYSRLRNSLTTGCILDNMSLDYNNGIYIDVFVMDGYIEDEKLLKNQERKLNILLKIGNLYKRNMPLQKPVRSCLKKILYYLMSFSLFRIISYERICDAFIKCKQMYNNKTNRVAIIEGKLHGVKKNWCKKEDLENIKYLQFENIMVPIPINYHDMLTHAYGNYMEFPPVEKRGTWHEGIIEFDPETPYKEYIKNKSIRKC